MPEMPQRREEHMNDTSEVYWIHVQPRKHTGETIALMITLLVLFVLMYLVVGHPARPAHTRDIVPAHASEKR